MFSPSTLTTLLLTTTAAMMIQGAAAQVNFEWDCTNSLGPCNNACFAVNHGLAPGTLTYDDNQANRRPRRTASGCNRNPCNNGNLPYGRWGNSCDEYPFASTTEGGAGAILRCVDSSENNSEGGSLRNFYRNLANGDQFNVWVRNYAGANFCDVPTATNDGSEFRLQNGGFVNAKLRKVRRALGFADAVPNPEGKVVNKLREFEDEEGGRLLSLNNDPDAVLVGSSVSNGNRTLKIVKEITRK